ncbi:ABC transporter ATP-binding protein [Tabrizicola sp. WMC-M-20]|nr:ABC transporter ATP-binding protein [Tabrizicola sp. WMC-M-20]
MFCSAGVSQVVFLGRRTDRGDRRHAPLLNSLYQRVECACVPFLLSAAVQLVRCCSRYIVANSLVAVLFIKHDMGVVAELAGRVAVMLQGRSVDEGRAGRIFDQPLHDYTRRLLAAAPKFHEAQARHPSASPQAAPVLSVNHLGARFPVRTGLLRRHTANLHAVEDVSFDLHPGETVALIGESGCGKSSLAKCLLRLVTAQTGRALLAGKDFLSLIGPDLRLARNDIRTVFQDPYAALDPRMSVRQNLTELLRIRGQHRTEKASNASLVSLIAREGLPEDGFDRFSHQFSGGRCQRIGIARALVLRLRVLIAEEPVSALDVAVQEQVLTVLERLTREEGTGLLFISHDMAVVERIAAQKLRVAEVLWGFSGVRPAEPVFGRNHVMPAFRQLYEGRRVGNGSNRATSRRKTGVSPRSSGWSSSSAKRRPA